MEIKTEYTKGVLKRVLSLNVETMNICNRAVTEPTKIHHCSVSLSRVRMFIRSMPDIHARHLHMKASETASLLSHIHRLHIVIHKQTAIHEKQNV